MRIGIDIRELRRGKKTGMGKYLLNFLEYINEYDHNNEYVLFANTDTALPSLREDIKLKVIPEFLRIFWDQIILKRQIEKEKIDIFYSPYYKGPMFSSAKLVVSCHDLHFLKLNSKSISNILRIHYCRNILKKADTIITVSEYSKQSIQKFLGNICPRIEVIYDSVSDRFQPLDKEKCLKKIRESFDLKDNFILYVGNLKPHKNLIRLFEAYNLLSSSLQEKYQIAIVGEKDSNYFKLRRFVRDKGFKDNIIFLGLVEEEDLIYLYNASSMLVLVSLHEGFGLPVLEAMACGAPVLVSNTTSLPEIVDDATGVFVDPYDVNDISYGLKRLLTDEDLKNTLSKKGLIRAMNFSVEKMAKGILRILEENYY